MPGRNVIIKRHNIQNKAYIIIMMETFGKA